jgi:hypothetical protein
MKNLQLPYLFFIFNMCKMVAKALLIHAVFCNQTRQKLYNKCMYVHSEYSFCEYFDHYLLRLFKCMYGHFKYECESVEHYLIQYVMESIPIKLVHR